MGFPRAYCRVVAAVRPLNLALWPLLAAGRPDSAPTASHTSVRAFVPKADSPPAKPGVWWDAHAVLRADPVGSVP